MMNIFIKVNIIPICKRCCLLCLLPLKKYLPSPFNLTRKKVYLELIWKKSLLTSFESYRGIPYYHRQSRRSMVNTLLMVNTTPICKRQFKDKFLLFSHFYHLMYLKKRKLGLYLQQTENVLALNQQIFSQQTGKKNPLW